MTKNFIVGVREVHMRHYKVMATDEEEARALVDYRGPEVIDLEARMSRHEAYRGAVYPAVVQASGAVRMISRKRSKPAVPLENSSVKFASLRMGLTKDAI